jgi:hypothetical protein
MAITLVSKPKLYCPAHYEVPFVFSMSDLGTPPTRIDFGCYLADNSGTRLHPLNKKFKPRATGVQFKKDFRTEAERQVYTSFPTESAAAQNDPNIIKKVKLYYGEVTFNSTTCETITNAITTQSSVINLINSNVNTDTVSLFGTSSGFSSPRTGLLLSQRPDRWKGVYGFKDYLWFLGTGRIDVTFYLDTTTVGTHSFILTGADTVKYISLDQLNYSHTGSITKTKIVVYDGTSDTGDTYYIDYCCKPDQNDYVGILFLEPLGGRANLATGRPSAYTLDRSGVEIHKTFDLSNTSVISGQKGMALTQGLRKRTFKTEVIDCDGAIRWIENFFSSPGHHAQKGYGSSTVWEKFILETGSYTVYEDRRSVDITFTGHLSEGINTQVEDI